MFQNRIVRERIQNQFFVIQISSEKNESRRLVSVHLGFGTWHLYSYDPPLLRLDVRAQPRLDSREKLLAEAMLA